MKVDPQKIANLMEKKGITSMRLSLEAQITPVYWSKIMTTGTCCKEIAKVIADTLTVGIEDIV